MTTEELLKKQEFVEKLSKIYEEMSDGDIVSMQYVYGYGNQFDDFEREIVDYMERVVVTYKSDCKRIINVSADSRYGIFCDVYKRIRL